MIDLYKSENIHICGEEEDAMIFLHCHITKWDKSVYKELMIAWDESQEAARAVHDAMPFLEYAEDVQIVSVSDKLEEQKANIIYNDDLRKHLSHHGINAEVINADELADGIGKTILQCGLEFDADLIVMGAYGETRLKEVVLGGVTRFLLKHTTIPLFLSH